LAAIVFEVAAIGCQPESLIERFVFLGGHSAIVPKVCILNFARVNIHLNSTVAPS
jgi:hypothetical protein